VIVTIQELIQANKEIAQLKGLLEITVIEESPVMGVLSDCVQHLKSMPAEIIQEDLLRISSTDAYDNASLYYPIKFDDPRMPPPYDPSTPACVSCVVTGYYEIKHTRSMNFKFRHNCTATVRRIKFRATPNITSPEEGGCSLM